nr:glycosyltransferase [Spirochaetota bacterium]
MSLTVSVVTICKQNRDELAATLDSILGQEPPVHSCVVIDGGSTDGTPGLLREYEARFSGRLDWISEPDAGISDAFNKGLTRARGEAIIFLNAGDIFIDGTYCARAAGLLAANPDAAFVHADILFSDGLAGEIRLAACTGQNPGRG